MSFRYLKIMLVALALVFISQGCFPPPPSPIHHRHNYRHWHGSSLQQSPQPTAQLANHKSEHFGHQEKGGYSLR